MRDENRYRRNNDDRRYYADRDYDRFNESGRDDSGNSYGDDRNFGRSDDYSRNNGGRFSNDNQQYGGQDRWPGRDSYRSRTKSPYGGRSNDYSGNHSFENRNRGTGNYGNDWAWSNDRDSFFDFNDSDRDYRRSGYGRDDRGWWDKTKDEVSSWFGDDDAQRRRRMDEMRDNHRGKGPKNYKRSSDRIKEDVNDRLSDHWMLDASNIEVDVKEGDVTLSGTVGTRNEKRMAEDAADAVSGVNNVQNNIRVSKTENTQFEDMSSKNYTSRNKKTEMQNSNS